MRDLAWVNGEITALHDAKVSFLDHGYFFGYGVYEALKVYQGKVYAVEEHLERLERSMKEIKIKPDFTREDLKKIMNELIEQSGWKQEALVYFQITRGVGPRMQTFPGEAKPTLAFFITNLPPLPQSVREAGVKAITLPDDRWAHPHIKTLNLLPNVLAKQTAEEQGAYEAILVRDGRITEASSSNVFAVYNDTVVTPPTDGKILSGISRLLVLRFAAHNNIKCQEKYITLEELRKADEVFVTNTGAEILAVTSLDGQQIADGVPGPYTKKLYDLFMADVRQFIDE